MISREIIWIFLYCKLLLCMQGNDFCERFACRWDLWRVMNIFWWRIREKVWNDIHEVGDVTVELLHSISFMAIHNTNFKKSSLYTQSLFSLTKILCKCMFINTEFGFVCLCLRVCLHGRWCHWICIVGFGRGLVWYKTKGLSN